MLSLVPFVVFLGFVAGAILKHLIPEELEAGERYFVWTERILLLLIAFIASSAFVNTAVVYVIFLAGIIAGYVVREPYLFFGAAMTSLNFILGMLVFLFGIPFGNRKTVAKNAIMLAVPFVLLLLPIDVTYILTFVSGACVALVFRYKR